jgi:quercetin dioxygenase-like cupin family protein
LLARFRSASRALSRGRAVLLLTIALVAIGAVGVAMATPGEGTVGTLLSRGVNADEVKIHTDEIKFKTRGPTDIVVVTQTWQPGGHSGWHTHSGTISVFDPTCTERVISAGQAFVEPVGEPMEVKNYGTVPAVAYFAIVLAPGAAGRDDAPNPGCDIP